MSDLDRLGELVELRDGSFVPQRQAGEIMVGIGNIVDQAIEGGIAERLALEALVRARQSLDKFDPTRYSDRHECALKHRLGREAIVMIRLDPNMLGPEDPRRLVARRIIQNMVVPETPTGDDFRLQSPFALPEEQITE